MNINLQKWQIQNVNTDRFANGDIIPEVKTKKEKEDAVQNRIPAWCIDLDDPNRVEKLYNIHVINDSRKLLPSNFRFPDKSDFIVLESHLKNDLNNFDNLNIRLRSNSLKLWSSSKCSSSNFSKNVIYAFHIMKDWAGITTASSHYDYCSVRGIKSSNIYLLDVEPELTSEDEQIIKIYLEKGDLLFAEGNAKEAIATYLELIQKCVNEPKLYYKIGKAYLALGDTSKASDFFEKSILLDPNQSDSHYNCGISNTMKASGISYAEPYFDMAIKLNPTKSDYYLARAEERDKIQNYEGYIEDIEKAKLEVLPYKYYERRSNIKARKGDYLGAIADYDILIDLSNYPRYFYYRGIFKLDLDNHSALNDFIKALELNEAYKTDDRFLGEYGNVLYKNGKLSEALDALSIGIQIQKKDGSIRPQHLYFRSKCYFDLGRYEEALTDINDALNTIVVNSQYLILFIEILIKLSRYDEAHDALRKFKENSEEGTSMHQDQYHFLLGEVYLMTKKYQLAYSNYKKAGELGHKTAYERIVKFQLTDSPLLTESFSPKERNVMPQNFNQSLNQQRYPSYFMQKEKLLSKYKLYLDEIEYQKVISKVNSSESLKKFINFCHTKKILPKEDVFVRQISVSRSFMFVFNYNKIDVACIELFDIWVKEVNMKYNLCEDESLIFILNDILKSSQNLATGK